MTNEKQTEQRRGMLIAGVITLGVGLVFLLDELDILPGFDRLWPVFPIIVGAALIIGSFYGKHKQDESSGGNVSR